MAKRQKRPLQAPPQVVEPNAPVVEAGQPLPSVEVEAQPEFDVDTVQVADTPPIAVSEPPESTIPFQAATPRTILNLLSIEAVLYIFLFGTALILRCIGLGNRPLSQDEAYSAIGAWDLLQGHGASYIGSPFLFSTNLFLFFLGGPTEAAVRILPALAGSLLVVFPALLRRELGRTGSLIASVLILLSTTLVFYSRDSNGSEISILAGFAAAIGVWRYVNQGEVNALYAGALGAAASLTSSALGFTLVLAGVLFVPLYRWLASREARESFASEDGQWNSAEPNSDQPVRRSEWRNAFLVFAATYLVIATAFTANREGLGASLDLVGNWLTSFSNPGPLSSPLNLLPVYEPLLLVFGFAGLLLILSLRGEELRTRGVVLYFGAVLVVDAVLYSLSSDKSPSNSVVLVVPLAVLAGWLIANLLERSLSDIEKSGGWRVAAFGELPILVMAMAFAALVYLQLVTLMQQNRFSPNVDALRQLLPASSGAGEFTTALIILGLFTLFFGAFLVLLAIGTIGPARAANLGSLVLVLILGISGVRALWLANFSGLDTVDESIAGLQTSLQAKDLVSDLEWLSEWREIDRHILPVIADENLGPVLKWYLRGFKNVRWISHPEASAIGEALLTSADAPAPAGAWIDQKYRLQMEWRPQSLGGNSLWKWLIFRDGGVEDWQYVKLWAPSPE